MSLLIPVLIGAGVLGLVVMGGSSGGGKAPPPMMEEKILPPGTDAAAFNAGLAAGKADLAAGKPNNWEAWQKEHYPTNAKSAIAGTAGYLTGYGKANYKLPAGGAQQPVVKVNQPAPSGGTNTGDGRKPGAGGNIDTDVLDLGGGDERDNAAGAGGMEAAAYKIGVQRGHEDAVLSNRSGQMYLEHANPSGEMLAFYPDMRTREAVAAYHQGYSDQFQKTYQN